MRQVPKRSRAVVLVETHEFREIRSRQFRVALDLEQVLVVLVSRVVAEVRGAGIDRGIVGIGVDDDELVVDVYRRGASLLLSRFRRWQRALAAQVDRAQLREESGRRLTAVEERVRQDFLVLSRARNSVTLICVAGLG